MKSFTYVIADRAGIHARPAGIVVKEAKKYESSVLFRSGDREADGKKLAPLMALGIKCGDEVIVEVDGPDEVCGMRCAGDGSERAFIERKGDKYGKHMA